jgi:hypothetical protein
MHFLEAVGQTFGKVVDRQDHGWDVLGFGIHSLEIVAVFLFGGFDEGV